jgi:hypothetical protein
MVGFVDDAFLLVLAVAAQAQQPTKIPRIAYLSRDLHAADSRAALPHDREANRRRFRRMCWQERVG